MAQNDKNTAAYNNQSISMLKGADRVRKRPAVIFGSDGLEGCEHSFFEILSNAVDEAREGHGNEIIVTVWRDHDHLHAHRPDGIFTGVIRYLGWEPYFDPAAQDVPFSFRFTLPETTVAGLAAELRAKLGMNGLRFVGDPDAKIRNVAIVGHLFPGGFDERTEADGTVVGEFRATGIRPRFLDDLVAKGISVPSAYFDPTKPLV